MHSAPEILAPAGNLEKLKIAVLYGADAVYLGGQKFGLRSAADNFTYEELEEGVAFAHNHGSRVYVVLNSFLYDNELDELRDFLIFIEKLAVDAVIVSDLGVVKTVCSTIKTPVHLSTQATCLNTGAALFWKEMGVKRIVLGREVSISQAAEIKKITGLEIEMFIHGSMCMSYSGNCTISNFTQGRDSNRGGCAQSCRFEYTLNLPDGNSQQAYFMSSKDLAGISLLQDFIDAGIDSLKIEGRMKTHHYVATITSVYSSAIKYYKTYGNFLSTDMVDWERELSKVGHRDYSSGNLVAAASADSIYTQRDQSEKKYQVAGIILEVQSDYLLVEVRSAFFLNDTLELISFKEGVKSFKANFITNILGEKCLKTKPGTLVKVPAVAGAMAYNVLRAKVAL